MQHWDDVVPFLFIKQWAVAALEIAHLDSFHLSQFTDALLVEFKRVNSRLLALIGRFQGLDLLIFRQVLEKHLTLVLCAHVVSHGFPSPKFLCVLAHFTAVNDALGAIFSLTLKVPVSMHIGYFVQTELVRMLVFLVLLHKCVEPFIVDFLVLSWSNETGFLPFPLFTLSVGFRVFGLL